MQSTFIYLTIRCSYLYQMLNGWLLGKTGYDLGSFGNLKKCGSDS